ncbi:hypothetical protein GW17_00024874 [Ensete ventricosum]|nr:hypothetical protein GW17_00024874 [Ensete ventricosum]
MDADAGSITSHDHLVCRPTHGNCARRRPSLRVDAALQVIAPAGAVPQADAPTGAVLQATTPTGGALQAATPVGGCPRRGPWPQLTAPLQVAKRWSATLAEGLAVVGHPLSSL